MITVYEVPVTKWPNKGKEAPSDKVLDKCRVVASGTNHREALDELVAGINSEQIDDINCYLYVKEE